MVDAGVHTGCLPELHRYSYVPQGGQHVQIVLSLGYPVVEVMLNHSQPAIPSHSVPGIVYDVSGVATSRRVPSDLIWLRTGGWGGRTRNGAHR